MSFAPAVAVPVTPAVRRTALFVDGENLPSCHAGRILTTLGPRGLLGLARVYGDMTRGVWAGATGFRFVHSGSGKNAADLLLCVEAMAAWHTGRYTTMAIATSDRDFSHLALWLREAGAEVIGFGEAKASAALRDACSRWVELLVPEVPAKPADQQPATPPVPPLSPVEAAVVAELIGAGGSMTLQLIASRLGMTYRKAALPEGTWSAFFAARPQLFALDGSVANRRVRLVHTRSTATRSLA